MAGLPWVVRCGGLRARPGPRPRGTPGVEPAPQTPLSRRSPPVDRLVRTAPGGAARGLTLTPGSGHTVAVACQKTRCGGVIVTSTPPELLAEEVLHGAVAAPAIELSGLSKTYRHGRQDLVAVGDV